MPFQPATTTAPTKIQAPMPAYQPPMAVLMRPRAATRLHRAVRARPSASTVLMTPRQARGSQVRLTASEEPFCRWAMQVGANT